MSRKKGFLLMEIIISILLLSVVGIALLKMNANQQKIYNITANKIEYSRYISILLNIHDVYLDNKSYNMYNIVKSRYNIQDKELINILKKIKINYKQKYKSMINLKLRDKKNSVKFIFDEINLSGKKGISTFSTVHI
jgi:hypothetical protein